MDLYLAKPVYRCTVQLLTAMQDIMQLKVLHHNERAIKEN